jgi:hypothetical protein
MAAHLLRVGVLNARDQAAGADGELSGETELKACHLSPMPTAKREARTSDLTCAKLNIRRARMCTLNAASTPLVVGRDPAVTDIVAFR